MILEATTSVEAPPVAVFRFFEEMPDNYERWHPDHVNFQWVEGNELAEGTVAYFEERIAGELRQQTVRFTEVEPHRTVAFRPTGRLVGLLMPEVRFTIDEAPGYCTITQRIRIRTGPIGAWLNRREFDAVRTHMAEEGANLKRILESET